MIDEVFLGRANLMPNRCTYADERSSKPGSKPLQKTAKNISNLILFFSLSR